MNLQASLYELREVFEKRLTDKVCNLPEIRQQYITFVQITMSEHPYSLFPNEMKTWLFKLVSTYNHQVLTDINQLVVVDLMLSSLRSLEPKSIGNQYRHLEALPPRVIESVIEWFEYLVDSMVSGNYAPDIKSDLFKKDLAISALNMWPSSSICHYEMRALPRRFLTVNGITQFCSAANMLLNKIKDRQFMYEFHMEDRRKNPHFLEAGWRAFYLEIAQRLKSETHVSGIFAQSWFWDPEVVKTFPKMMYLRALPESGGAMFFLLETCDDPSHVALQNKKRQRLYEQKLYTPKSYLMVWPRKMMLRWANEQQLTDDNPPC
jgi:hypothetical protein